MSLAVLLIQQHKRQWGEAIFKLLVGDFVCVCGRKRYRSARQLFAEGFVHGANADKGLSSACALCAVGMAIGHVFCTQSCRGDLIYAFGCSNMILLSVVSEHALDAFSFWSFDIHKESETSGTWAGFAREDFPKLDSNPASHLTPPPCIFVGFSFWIQMRTREKKQWDLGVKEWTLLVATSVLAYAGKLLGCKEEKSKEVLRKWSWNAGGNNFLFLSALPSPMALPFWNP